MEVATCPKCGRRYIVGSPCTCLASPVSNPAQGVFSQEPGAQRSRASSTITGAAIILISVLVIGAIVYGIGSARLKSAEYEPTRSGEVSTQYAHVLSDPQSAQALLELIESKPGYDRYVICYRSVIGTVDVFSYEFSSDQIIYVQSASTHEAVPFIWEGDGIERLRREAAGGTLD